MTPDAIWHCCVNMCFSMKFVVTSQCLNQTDQVHSKIGRRFFNLNKDDDSISVYLKQKTPQLLQRSCPSIGLYWKSILIIKCPKYESHTQTKATASLVDIVSTEETQRSRYKYIHRSCNLN